MFLGIDGGATKTRAVVVDGQGKRLGQGRAGPSNYQVVGLETAIANLVQAVCQALDQASVSPGQVMGGGAGLAGLDSPVDVAPVRALMTAGWTRVGLRCPWLAVNDSVAAWAGALEGRPGAVILSGSGAIALAVDDRRRSAQADGWGHWLGDEGSGFDIGRQGLRAALRAVDGRGPSTKLVTRMAARFGHPLEDRGARWLAELSQDAARSHRDITRFAQDVMDAAEAEDPVARAILEEAGQALAHTVAAALRPILWTGRPPVAPLGSVLAKGPLVREALARHLALLLPGAHLVAPAMPPAEGAALLGRCPELAPADRIAVRSETS